MAVSMAVKERIVSAVLEKFRKEQIFSLNCRDGRIIDVDPCTDGETTTEYYNRVRRETFDIMSVQ